MEECASVSKTRACNSPCLLVVVNQLPEKPPVEAALEFTSTQVLNIIVGVMMTICREIFRKTDESVPGRSEDECTIHSQPKILG